MDENDKQLVSSYIKGEEKALEELVSRHLKPVYNFVYRISGSKKDAEDITQETFIKVWRKIKKYNPDKNFKTWLFTIARNTAIDWLRKKRDIIFSNFEDSEGGNYLENELIDPNPLPDKIFAQAEDQEFVENLLRQLAPIYREVLILKYANDLTF
ncbi:MAG: RNA polymerase sigma factor [Patescibacteria group bacterium]